MTTETLGEELPKVMAHVRDKIMPVYIKIGPAGGFALMMMRASMDRATKALAEGDIIAMIRSYEELKEFKL